MFWSLILVIVPLAVLGGLGYSSARRAVVREVFLHMESVAGHKRAHIEDWISERITDLRMLAADGCVVDFFSRGGRSSDVVSQVSELFSFHLKNNRAFERIALFDTLDHPAYISEGTAPEEPFLRSASVGRDEWRAVSGDILVGAVNTTPELGTWFLMSKDVETKGERIGRIVVQVLLSRSLESILLDSTGLGRTGHAYLVDRSRLMLTRSRLMGHPAPGTHRMFSAAIDSALHRGSGTGTYTGWNGEPALGSWQYIPSMDWALIAEMDPAEALAELTILKRSWLLVSLLTLFAVLVIVAVLARSISRPVLDLTRAAENIARGDLTVPTGVNRSDEIGTLAKTFKQMQSALAESQLSLKDSYQRLIQAERRVAQSEKLAAIGEVVAGVVHELRNPLSAVKMNLKILSRKLKPDDPTYKNVLTAQEQSLKLERMLTQILEYAKPVEPALAPVDLAVLIREAFESLQHRIREAGIEVVWDIPRQPVTIHCDRDLIFLALSNILDNAVNAMAAEKGGKLKIAVSGNDPASSGAQIEISDTGVGLSPTQIERIFEPFYTTRRDGTGLGLPNAKKMIELHRGHLEVDSTPGKGTTVRIFLPRGENDA